MQVLIERVAPTRFSRRDWLRNIVSLRRGEDLYDDLADGSGEQAHLQAVEMDHKPPAYRGQAILNRPFVESAAVAPVADAIVYPYRHPLESRYSDGRFGVWYGANTLLTGAYETAYHWHRRFIAAREHDITETVVQERKVFRVQCTSALLDLRPQIQSYPALIDKDSYNFCRQLGAQLHKDGYPGVLSRSARTPYPSGLVAAVFRREALANPRDECYLTYHWSPDERGVRVERKPGHTWKVLNI